MSWSTDEKEHDDDRAREQGMNEEEDGQNGRIDERAMTKTAGVRNNDETQQQHIDNN